jgi:hypothetical protein
VSSDNRDLDCFQVPRRYGPGTDGLGALCAAFWSGATVFLLVVLIGEKLNAMCLLNILWMGAPIHLPGLLYLARTQRLQALLGTDGFLLMLGWPPLLLALFLLAGLLYRSFPAKPKVRVR